MNPETPDERPVTSLAPLPGPAGSSPEPPILPDFVWALPPRKKFQHRWARHILLFAATVLTTTAVGTLENLTGDSLSGLLTWEAISRGLLYSLPVLTILSAHEFGHYFACRYYNVDATLPFFIPLPLPPTGTLGAVIRIREMFPSKKALFDIGVAGPIAGFVMLLPFLYFGVAWSRVEVIPPGAGGPIYGNPLLLELLARWRFGPFPPGGDLILNPMMFAAWWGMLATALNLMPFGQLDGGHISYAVFGRRAAVISVATLICVALLTLRSGSWTMTALMMLAMAIFMGFRHPRVIDEHEPLDLGRMTVAALALVIFVLCFMPVPIQLF